MEIGGYFELELAHKGEYHSGAIRLNSGRNAFKYILQAHNIQKVYIPVFICNSIIEPLRELNVCYEFYNVDEEFEIVQKIELNSNERLLYANYFSLKSVYIEKLALKYGKNLIVDNTQAFFEKPIECIETIYSPRKYFGVCDGGYLYTQRYIEKQLEEDVSYSNALQLLGRVDVSASDFYKSYKKAEEGLSGRPIKKMSKLTSKILSSIDYDSARYTRERNYYYIHGELKKFNLMHIRMPISSPFVYPLKVNDRELRNNLIANKVYIAKYWDDVLVRDQVSGVEKDLVNKIIPLPIDQRYGLGEMKRIVDIIKDELE